jgi:hypothetical protein
MKLLRAISRAVRAFYAHLTPAGAFFVSAMFVLLAMFMIGVAVDAYHSWLSERAAEVERRKSADEARERAIRFSQLTPIDHLRSAAQAREKKDFQEARKHIAAIPQEAAEHSAASILLSDVERDEDEDRKALAEERKRQEDAVRERMIANITGKYHDKPRCSTSTKSEVIMSFDNGVTWWLDDGRCALIEQKKRDQEAQSSSYWPTTIRVDTDMDSFWLNNEERTCQTFPDQNGRVSVVACNSSGNHRAHNIPVKFWGGVKRNTVSDWKCRREGEDFVCRAIN